MPSFVAMVIIRFFSRTHRRIRRVLPSRVMSMIRSLLLPPFPSLLFSQLLQPQPVRVRRGRRPVAPHRVDGNGNAAPLPSRSSSSSVLPVVVVGILPCCGTRRRRCVGIVVGIPAGDAAPQRDRPDPFGGSSAPHRRRDIRGGIGRRRRRRRRSRSRRFQEQATPIDGGPALVPSGRRRRRRRRRRSLAPSRAVVRVVGGTRSPAVVVPARDVLLLRLASRRPRPIADKPAGNDRNVGGVGDDPGRRRQCAAPQIDRTTASRRPPPGGSVVRRPSTTAIPPMAVDDDDDDDDDSGHGGDRGRRRRQRKARRQQRAAERPTMRCRRRRSPRRHHDTSPPPAAADKRAISRVRLSPEKNGVKLPKAWQSLFVAVGGAAWGLSLRHKSKRRIWRYFGSITRNGGNSFSFARVLLP